MIVTRQKMMMKLTWTEGSSSLSLNALSSRSKGCRTNIIVTPDSNGDGDDIDDETYGKLRYGMENRADQLQVEDPCKIVKLPGNGFQFESNSPLVVKLGYFVHDSR